MKVTDVNQSARTVLLGPRPSPVPLDPVTWAATELVLAHHTSLDTHNPHLLVNRRTRVNDQPVSNGANGPSMSSSGRFVAFTSRSNVEFSGGTVPDFDSEVWMRERAVALDITATLNFGKIDFGSQSPPQDAVVTNTSGVVINIGSVTPPGSPFIITGNSCGGVLPAGGSCTITVVFRPTVAGSASSSITVSGRRNFGICVRIMPPACGSWS